MDIYRYLHRVTGCHRVSQNGWIIQSPLHPKPRRPFTVPFPGKTWAARSCEDSPPKKDRDEVFMFLHISFHWVAMVMGCMFIYLIFFYQHFWAKDSNLFQPLAPVLRWASDLGFRTQEASIHSAWRRFSSQLSPKLMGILDDFGKSNSMGLTSKHHLFRGCGSDNLKQPFLVPGTLRILND